MRILRWFSTEQLGDPTKDLQTQIDKLTAFIHDRIGENFNVPIEGLIVFSNPKVSVEITNVDLPVIVLNQDPDGLKNALKKSKTAPALTKEQYDALYTLFEEEAEARSVEAQRGLVIAGRKLL